MFLIITLFILMLLVLMQKAYIKNPDDQKSVVPGLAYFHIPLPEFKVQWEYKVLIQ